MPILDHCSIRVKLNSATKHYDSLCSRGIAMRMHGSEQATEIKFLAGPAEALTGVNLVICTVAEQTYESLN